MLQKTNYAGVRHEPSDATSAKLSGWTYPMINIGRDIERLRWREASCKDAKDDFFFFFLFSVLGPWSIPN